MSIEHEPQAQTGPSPGTASGPARPLVWALVLLGAIAPPVAISYGCWQFHRTVAQLVTGSPLDVSERATSSVTTAAGIVGVALVVQAAVGLIFLGWLYRVRTNAQVISRARHRYGPGWALGVWFVPVANLVLPRVIVADVLRASRPDGPPAVAAVNAWWIATVVARTIHAEAWVLLVMTFLGMVSPSGYLTAAVVHTIGTLCSVAAGLLLGRIVIGVSDGQHHLSARSPGPVGDEHTGNDPEVSDPPQPAGVGSWLGSGLSIMRRSAAPLLVLAVLAAAADAVALLDDAAPLRSDAEGRGIGSSAFGIGGALGGLGGGTNWAADLLTLAAHLVRAFTYSAAMVVAVRLGSSDVASVLVGMRVAVRRFLPLLGWLLAAMVMAAIGLLFLVVPGIYVLIVIAATLIAVVTLEERDVRRCFDLARGRFWATAVRLVLLLAAAQVWWLVAFGISFQIVTQPAASILLFTILGAPGYVLAASFLAATYTELKIRDDQRTESSGHLDEPPALATATEHGTVIVESKAHTTGPASEPGMYADRPLPQLRASTSTTRDGMPVGLGERSSRSSMPLTIAASGGVLIVLTVFATIGVMHVITPAPASDQAAGPREPAVGTSGPASSTPPVPTAADVLAPILAQSRRDGSGTYVFTPGHGYNSEYLQGAGTFAYRGDAVSVQTILTDQNSYLSEIVVINDEARFKVRSPIEGQDAWGECSKPDQDTFCSQTGYIQDFADPVQLLVRAGPAAKLVTSKPGTVDGAILTRHEFEFKSKQVVNEVDPFWQARLRWSWLQAGEVHLWVDSQHRLRQMVIGDQDLGDKISYVNWGNGGQ